MIRNVKIVLVYLIPLMRQSESADFIGRRARHRAEHIFGNRYIQRMTATPAGRERYEYRILVYIQSCPCHTAHAYRYQRNTYNPAIVQYELFCCRETHKIYRTIAWQSPTNGERRKIGIHYIIYDYFSCSKFACENLFFERKPLWLESYVSVTA